MATDGRLDFEGLQYYHNTKVVPKINGLLPVIINDTNYFDVMKAWFLSNGCNVMTDFPTENVR